MDGSPKLLQTEERAYRASVLGLFPIISRRSDSRPTKNMASQLRILLSLALFAYTIASPVPETTEATTIDPDKGVIPIYAVIEVIQPIPEIVEVFDEATTEAPAETTHKVAKRSLRGDNPSNDLLAQYDGSIDDTGLSSLAGRRIKFLPTWAG